MIRDSVIQLFLRGILLDGIEREGLSVDILYENTKKKNLASVYAVEQLFPLGNTAYNSVHEWGEGIYKLTFFSNVGEGLKFTDMVDTVASFFDRGVHVVDAERKISICIDDVDTTELIYSDSSDKVQKSLSVVYRKFINL